jgi:hypothetical protein
VALDVADTPNGLHPTQSWHATASAPDGGIYVAGMDHRTNAALYAFDLASGRTRRLCALAELDPTLAHSHNHTGYDAWDAQGRLYVASFGGPGTPAMAVSRTDPAGRGSGDFL